MQLLLQAIIFSPPIKGARKAFLLIKGYVHVCLWLSILFFRHWSVADKPRVWIILNKYNLFVLHAFENAGRGRECIHRNDKHLYILAASNIYDFVRENSIFRNIACITIGRPYGDGTLFIKVGDRKSVV